MYSHTLFHMVFQEVRQKNYFLVDIIKYFVIIVVKFEDKEE